MKAITHEWLAVYIQSRYPGEMGLLPSGKPSQAEAQTFYSFAQKLFQEVQTALKATDIDNS